MITLPEVADQSKRHMVNPRNGAEIKKLENQAMLEFVVPERIEIP
jgi:hypothetical protein